MQIAEAGFQGDCEVDFFRHFRKACARESGYRESSAPPNSLDSRVRENDECALDSRVRGNDAENDECALDSRVRGNDAWRLNASCNRLCNPPGRDSNPHGVPPRGIVNSRNGVFRYAATALTLDASSLYFVASANAA